MRGTVPGLVSPMPYLSRVPGVLQEDDFLARFLSAFDEVIAPAIATLDGLDSYLRPDIAPDDFVELLAAWVAVDADDRMPLAVRRQAVAAGIEWHRHRGTAGAVAEAVRRVVGQDTDVRVTESGATTVSATAGGTMPGSSTPQITIDLSRAGKDIDSARVLAAARAIVPAHVLIRLVTGSATPAAEPEPAPSPNDIDPNQPAAAHPPTTVIPAAPGNIASLLPSIEPGEAP